MDSVALSVLQSALAFRSFSVFFVEFVAVFDSRQQISCIASVGILVQQFGSPVGSALSTDIMVMTGGIMAPGGCCLPCLLLP